MTINHHQKIQFQTSKKQIALLIDPDKQTQQSLFENITNANESGIDFIFVGGSLIYKKLDNSLKTIKKLTSIPIVIFPGSVLQISEKADAILLLSLISGRNSEFLIGNHVIAAPFLKKSKLEIIPVGYILIDGGSTTSVEYISNTKPIPANKKEIAVATALAGEMLGHQAIYLEAGSGAINPVPAETIKAVKKEITIPLIVGGGINTAEKVRIACNSGANLIVIGTAFEKESNLMKTFSNIVHLEY